MRHQVDFPKSLPLLVVGIQSTFTSDPCVRAEQINRPNMSHRLVHQALNIIFACDIYGHCHATNFIRNDPGPRFVDIGYHHSLRAMAGELPAQSGPNSTCSTRNYHHFVLNMHNACLDKK
jgi:hypothetical protein